MGSAKTKKRNRHRKKWSDLGLPGGVSPATYERGQVLRRKWNTEHAELHRASQKRYSAKIKKAVGSTSPWARYLFKLMGGAKAFNEQN